MKDGRMFSKETRLTHQDYCFNLDKDIELIRSLLPEMVLPEERVDKIIKLIENLEDCEDVSQLMQMLTFPRKAKAARYVLPF